MEQTYAKSLSLGGLVFKICFFTSVQITASEILLVCQAATDELFMKNVIQTLQNLFDHPCHKYVLFEPLLIEGNG